MTRNSAKQQARNGELGLIIDEMGQAMWNADREYIASRESPLTPHMNDVLCKFQDFCVKYNGKA